MKTFIFAGGFGTRFAEMTDLMPKPMIQLGNHPILIHILSHYSKFGFKDFVILGGYKCSMISDYFEGPGTEIVKKGGWSIQVIDTGEGTSTAARLLKVRDIIPETFMLTYGDGLIDSNLNELQEMHSRSGLLSTVTAVRPPARFGTIEFQSGIATIFSEKDSQRVGWINGGFFCLNKKVIDYIENPEVSFEGGVLSRLAQERQLGVFAHEGFWHPMDTLRDWKMLEDLWDRNIAPWDYNFLR